MHLYIMNVLDSHSVMLMIIIIIGWEPSETLLCTTNTALETYSTQ